MSIVNAIEFIKVRFDNMVLDDIKLNLHIHYCDFLKSYYFTSTHQLNIIEGLTNEELEAEWFITSIVYKLFMDYLLFHNEWYLVEILTRPIRNHNALITLISMNIEILNTRFDEFREYFKLNFDTREIVFEGIRVISII